MSAALTSHSIYLHELYYTIMEPSNLLYVIPDWTLWLQSIPDDLVIFVSRFQGTTEWHPEASAGDQKLHRRCLEEDKALYDEAKVARLIT